MDHHLQIFSTPEKLSTAAADFILQCAEKAVRENGRFALALSGGRTPEQLFARLAAPPYREKMPWASTFIFWGDERCVPFDDERNNANMAQRILLDKIEIPTSHIYRIPVELSPEEGARQYEQMLHNLFDPDRPVFDLMLLGLGQDGHTASLFPGTAVLREQKRWVSEVFAEEQQMYRITMTLPLINQARAVLFLVAGKEKREILRSILQGATDAMESYPAQLVQPQKGEVYWFADTEAAAFLKTG